MAVTAKFGADFSDFQSAVSKAEVSLRSLESGAGKVDTSLNKMVNSFSGTKVIQDAALMAEAFERLAKEGIGLTTAELQKMGVTANAAIEKMNVMGIKIPDGIQKIADATKTATKETTNWQSALTSAAGAFGLAFSVGSIIQFGKAVFDSGSKIGDLASQLGISTDAVQGFQFAAEQSGSSLDAVGTAITKMNQQLGGGDKATVQALKNVGLEFAAIRAMKPEDAFLAITDALANTTDKATQTDSAVQLLGRSSAELLPAIKEGFRAVSDGANKMSAETIASLKGAQDAWSELSRNVTIVSGNMIAAMMDLGKAVTSSAASFGKFARDVVLFGAGPAANMAVAFNTATTAAKDFNLALPGPLPQTAEQLAAAAAAAQRFASAFAKWSGAAATAEMNLLDAVFRKLAASGQLTEKQINAIVKEALKLQEQGGKMTERLLDMVMATDALIPNLGMVAMNFGKIGYQVDFTVPKLEAFGVSVQKGAGDWGNLSKNVSKPEIPDAVKKATDSVGELAKAFAQLAQISGGSLGSVIQTMGTLVASLNTANKGVKSFQEGLSGFKAGDLLSGIAGMTTGIMGMASAAIAAGKAIAGLFDRSKGRDLVVDFAQTFGGFDQLHVELNALGDEGEKLWIALTQGVGRNNPKEAQAAIDAITKALEKKADASDDAVIMSEAEAQATIETAAAAAKALDQVNERLAVNRDAWVEWSLDVTGYLQKLADDIRAMPLPTPTGPSYASGGGAASGLYRGRAGSSGGGESTVTSIVNVDGVEMARAVSKYMPGVLAGAGR